MKIAVLADLHLNKSTYKGVMDKTEFPGLPFRSADFMRAFRWSVRECLRIHPDMIVINGDIYDFYDPNNEVRGFFSSCLQEISTAQIPVFIITGNHDVCMKHHALTDIEKLGLKNIQVYSDFAIKTWKDKGYNFMFFPYSLSIERDIRSFKDEFGAFLVEAKKKQNKFPSLFFGHFPVLGAAMNHFVKDNNAIEEEDGGEVKTRSYKNYNHANISAEELNMLKEVGVTHIFLGDFHEYQVIGGLNGIVGMYGGSIEKNSFNEKTLDKGFLLYDDSLPFDSETGYARRIIYPNVRPMKEIKGNLESIRKQMQEMDYSKYKDAILRITFEGNSNELKPFLYEYDSIKAELVEKTNAIHILYKQVIAIDEKSEEDALKLEKEIKNTGHISDRDVINEVIQIINEDIKDKEEQAEHIKIAEEIYKETIEDITI